MDLVVTPWLSVLLLLEGRMHVQSYLDLLVSRLTKVGRLLLRNTLSDFGHYSPQSMLLIITSMPLSYVDLMCGSVHEPVNRSTAVVAKGSRVVRLLGKLMGNRDFIGLGHGLGHFEGGLGMLLVDFAKGFGIVENVIGVLGLCLGSLGFLLVHNL